MRHASEESEFYYVEVESPAKYKTFRTLAGDYETGGIERVAGQRADGAWETVKWLIGKKSAHVAGGRLVADSREAQELFDRLGSEPKHIGGNRFEAKVGTRNAKKGQPTEARTKNIK